MLKTMKIIAVTISINRVGRPRNHKSLENLVAMLSKLALIT